MAALDVRTRRRDLAGSVSFREQFSTAPTSASLDECWMLPFEDARPVRAPAAFKGQRNFAGLWWCTTTDRHVGFESWCERDYLMCLDFDPGAVGMSSTSFRITLPDSLPQRMHDPDYFVRRANVSIARTPWLCRRIKTCSMPRTSSAPRSGWEYRRLGSIPTVYLANVALAVRARPGAGIRAERVGVRFCPNDPRSGSASGRPLAVLPTIFHLLWRQQIRTDLATRSVHLDS